MINKLKSIYFYLLYKVNKLKSAKIVCLEMVRLLCSEIWVFAFVGWRYVPSPPVLSRVNNNVMLIICHTVQHKIDFYLWNFKSTIRRMCLFMFWCWACHKTESTDLPFEYDHVCHGVVAATTTQIYYLFRAAELFTFCQVTLGENDVSVVRNCFYSSQMDT